MTGTAWATVFRPDAQLQTIDPFEFVWIQSTLASPFFLYVVGAKLMVILITMEYKRCGAELSGAETMSQVKTFDEVCLSVDLVIVSMVRRSVYPVFN